ncbi:MAG: hypothetical protein WAU47_09820 [Desulfobaccales bacterium]
MILKIVGPIYQAFNRGVVMNVIINDLAEGNAPLLAQLIAKTFLR